MPVLGSVSGLTSGASPFGLPELGHTKHNTDRPPTHRRTHTNTTPTHRTPPNHPNPHPNPHPHTHSTLPTHPTPHQPTHTHAPTHRAHTPPPSPPNKPARTGQTRHPTQVNWVGCEGWVVLAVAQRVLAKLGVLEDAHCLVKLQGGVGTPAADAPHGGAKGRGWLGVWTNG